MQDRPLTVTALFEHGRTVHAGSQVATAEGAHVRRASFATVGERAARLASTLDRLNIVTTTSALPPGAR
jgi:fatty-acyl-CoA synthase